MNLLMFNYEYPPLGGGGGIVHALMAEELAKRHRITVITTAYKGLPRSETRGGVHIHRVPVLARTDLNVASLVSMLSYPPAAWMKARGLLRREAFDVITTHFAVPTGPGAVLANMFKQIPHVLTVLGGDIFDPSKKLSPHRMPPIRFVVDSVLRNSEIVVTGSTNIREYVYRYYRYRGPIEVVPLGIRQPQVPEVSRSELGLPDGHFFAITVGRLIKRKALDQLLRALARPECAAVHLIVVGDGPESDMLKALSRELNLDARVTFTGRVDETRKWQLLACSDLYVSSTMHEGFGLVYLEGMAAGLPIVTFEHGGQVDFLEDGETGYLVKSGDVDGLAAAIAKVATDPAAARRFRDNNLRRAPQHRIEECARRFEALCQRAAERKGNSSRSR